MTQGHDPAVITAALAAIETSINKGLSLAPVARREPVRGTLEDFLALAESEDPAATLINSNLELIGNTAPLIALQQILSTMDLDWEAPLVDALGDVVGHQLASLLRALFQWGKASGSSLRRQLSEFILEEGRLTPPAAELDAFYSEIEQLGLRVDRLQGRIQKLAKRLGAIKP